jgi:CheY-like chemotaxis protein
MSILSALAIDDYAPTRYAHTRVLKKAGFEVFEAADGHTGLALAQTHVPDVVLLDLNLPDIHGFEVCERLKASHLTRHNPVIHLTATSRGERYRRESIRAGADRFMEEPVSADRLMRAVQDVISARMSAPGAAGDVLLLSTYDDERDMYGTALERAGCWVVPGSPEQGHDLATAMMPDVIVTRIRPGDSGLHLVRSLKEDPATAHIPIVVITTYTDALHRAAAEAMGVAAYFLLPVTPDRLVESVSRLLS